MKQILKKTKNENICSINLSNLFMNLQYAENMKFV